MEDIIEEKGVAEKLLDGAENIIDVYQDLLEVKLVEKVSKHASLSILGIIYLMLALCVLIFAGIGGAWTIGQRMDNMAAGFLIVGGAYMVLLLGLMVTSSKVWLPLVRNIVIKKMYEQD
jgi:hypothetical protein